MTDELLAEILATLQGGDVQPGTLVQRQGYQNTIWGSTRTLPRGAQTNAAGALVPVPFMEILRTPTLRQPAVFSVTLGPVTKARTGLPQVDQTPVCLVRWGIGGANFETEIDWLAGYTFTVAAQYVSISGRGDPVNGSDDEMQFTAGASVGAATTRPAQRTIALGNISPGATATFEVPPFAKRVRFVAGANAALDSDGSQHPALLRIGAVAGGTAETVHQLGRRSLSDTNLVTAGLSSTYPRPSWARRYEVFVLSNTFASWDVYSRQQNIAAQTVGGRLMSGGTASPPEGNILSDDAVQVVCQNMAGVDLNITVVWESDNFDPQRWVSIRSAPDLRDGSLENLSTAFTLVNAALIFELEL